jgi:uncharacterized membrane protein YkoI
MIKQTSLALAAAILIPAAAFAQLNVGSTIGSNEADIRTALESQGYTVLEFEMDDNEIEIVASLDGQNFEIEVSGETGIILEVELDDEDESDES